MQYVIASVFLVAALIVYVKGVREEKEGSYPLMIIFIFGAALGRFTPPQYPIMTVAVALLAFWVYRKSISGAKVLAVVFATLAVVIGVFPLTPLPENIEDWREERARERRRAERVRYRHVHFEMLGEKMAPSLSDGADVLLLKSPIEEGEFEELAGADHIEEGTTFEQWRESEKSEREAVVTENFEKGTGFSINIVDSVGVERRSGAREFNAAIEPYRDEIELILSDRLIPFSDPREYIYSVEDLDFHNWDNVPEFAIYLGSTIYTPDMLRDYIRDGLVSAIVLPESRISRENPRHEALIAIGPDNVEDLPAESPR